MLRTNEKKLVVTSVQGQPVYPSGRRPFNVDHQGRPFLLPSVGGITYNIKVGDSAFGWAGDHLEPCVSTMADTKDGYSALNASYHYYACIGNQARLISGEAKGRTGTVTGHHGGAEHIMIDFPQSVVEKMTLDDKILIRTVGQGLQLLDYPEIHCYNVDPALVRKMNIRAGGRILEVPVAAIVPGKLMGSGIGSGTVATGDYDIMTADPGQLKEHKLDKLKLGDIVAIMDHDNVYGRCYRKGAVSIGVVIHADCLSAGHGPGVTTIFSSAKPLLVPKILANANIGYYLKIGRYGKK
jgi:hypothetical protein